MPAAHINGYTTIEGGFEVRVLHDGVNYKAGKADEPKPIEYALTPWAFVQIDVSCNPVLVNDNVAAFWTCMT